jgi:FixJ family two-component response regulator
MPEMDGLELQQELVRRRARLPLIAMTGQGDVPLAVRAMKAGAVDFIEKPFGDQDMLRLIVQCLELDRANRARQLEAAAAAQRLAGLTEREAEVMDLILAGRLNKQIADVLNISIKTVEVHRGRIMDKMQVRTVAELVQTVMRGRQ